MPQPVDVFDPDSDKPFLCAACGSILDLHQKYDWFTVGYAYSEATKRYEESYDDGEVGNIYATCSNKKCPTSNRSNPEIYEDEAEIAD